MRGTPNQYRVAPVTLFGKLLHWEVFVNHVKAFVVINERHGGVKIVERFTKLRPNVKLIESRINGVY